MHRHSVIEQLWIDEHTPPEDAMAWATWNALIAHPVVGRNPLVLPVYWDGTRTRPRAVGPDGVGVYLGRRYDPPLPPMAGCTVRIDTRDGGRPGHPVTRFAATMDVAGRVWTARQLSDGSVTSRRRMMSGPVHRLLRNFVAALPGLYASTPDDGAVIAGNKERP